MSANKSFVPVKATSRQQALDLATLRRVLWRARWHDQGGFVGFHDGKWDFVTDGLPQATPKEWAALMRLAGIVPDQIIPRGSCQTCAFAEKKGGVYQERGWAAPCVSCARPRMSHWKLRPGARLVPNERNGGKR